MKPNKMQTMEGERGKSYSNTVLGRIGAKDDAPETLRVRRNMGKA